MEKYGAHSDNTTSDCHLQVIGFPCNQFGYQEPAENFELMNCLKYVRPGSGYEPNFPLMGKLEVNGHGESPIFTFLKASCPPPMGLIANRTDITWTPIRSSDISWNFSKWLLHRNGTAFKRYTPRTPPFSLEEDIIELITNCKKELFSNRFSNSTATTDEIYARQAGAAAQPVAEPAVPQQPNNPAAAQQVVAQTGRKKRSFFRIVQ